MKWQWRLPCVIFAGVLGIVSCGRPTTTDPSRVAGASILAPSSLVPATVPTSTAAVLRDPVPTTTTSSDAAPTTTIDRLRRDASGEDLSATLVASARAEANREPLVRSPGLDVLAREWARSMASRDVLEHSDNSAHIIDLGHAVAGENVGYSTSVERVHAAFLDSNSHRSTMLHPDLDELGVGVVIDANGRVWVAQLFAG